MWDELNKLYGQVQEARQGVQAIHNNKNSYYDTVQVPYTHKFKVSMGGWFKTNWVCGTETRYRPEERFDSERFNKDLDEASSKLQQAEAAYHSQTNSINSKIQNFDYSINQHDNSAKEVSSLYAGNQQLEYSISYARQYSTPESAQKQLMQRQTDWQEQQQDISYKQQVNPMMEQNLRAKKQELQSMALSFQQNENQKTELIKQLSAAYKALTPEQRGVLLYDALKNDQLKLAKLIKQHNPTYDKFANICADEQNSKLFPFALKQKADVNAAYGSEATTALKIIKSGNKPLLDALFAADLDMSTSIFMAVVKRDYSALQVMQQYKTNVLSKFIDMKFGGFGVVQYAITQNDPNLLKFCINTEAEVLQQKLLGYDDYLELCMVYQGKELLGIIDKHLDLSGAIINNLKKGRGINFLVELIQEKKLNTLTWQKVIKAGALEDYSDIAQEIAQNYPEFQAKYELKEQASQESEDTSPVKIPMSINTNMVPLGDNGELSDDIIE